MCYINNNIIIMSLINLLMKPPLHSVFLKQLIYLKQQGFKKLQIKQSEGFKILN